MSGKKTTITTSQHRAFLDNIKDACFEFDLNGKCTFCNEAAHQMLGYSRKEYLRLPHRQRYRTQAAADLVFHTYQTVFQTGVGQTIFESEMLCKDGSTIIMEMNVSPFFDSAARITGFRSIGRNITARKNDQAELER